PQFRTIARGKIESCQQCHKPLIDSDHLFRTYLPRDGSGKLRKPVVPPPSKPAPDILSYYAARARIETLPPIANFLKYDKTFCTGGQPRPEHLVRLKEDGIKVIINLREPSEYRSPTEVEMAARLGMRYIKVPVSYLDPKEEQVTEFLRVTDDKENRPAFI